MKVTLLPPGKARGAGDLDKWAKNRAVGRSGIKKKSMAKIARQASKAARCAHHAQKQFERERADQRNAVLAKIAFHDLHDAQKRRERIELQIKQRYARNQKP